MPSITDLLYRDLTTSQGEALELVIQNAIREAGKAMNKYPPPNYTITKVAEEAGEVVKAAVHCAEGREQSSAVIGEIEQLMAMLIRLLVEGDGVHGLEPLLKSEDS